MFFSVFFHYNFIFLIFYLINQIPDQNRVLSNAFNLYTPQINKNNLHLSLQSSGKKAPTRYDKHVRAFAEKKKFSKAQRAVTISIEGRNMAL